MKKTYHPDWKNIAKAIKDAAGWKCVKCDRICRRSGESWENFRYRLARKSKVVYTESFEHPGRFTLAVHHKNFDISDNSLVNLIALCAPCHLRLDAKYHAINAAKTRAKKKAVKKRSQKKK